MADRVILTQISPVAWEHPADRAALNALRAIPAVDDVIRKVAGFFGERGIRLLFAGNAVRIGPRQRPKLYGVYREVVETLDWPEFPDVYVTQTPIANAMAVGFERPFIVLNSGMLNVLNREEQRSVIGHELGHIMSGHAVYNTMVYLLVYIGLQNLPFLAGMAVLPIQLALFEWHRKSELSSDRAGLLATQEPNVSMSAEMKLAGGSPERRAGGGGEVEDDDLNLDEFLVQAEEYDTGGTAVDTIFKFINVAFKTHPFHAVRVAELHKWVRSGEYYRIIGGDYPRRGSDAERDFRKDFQEAGSYYGDQARHAMDQVNDVLNRARDAFSNAVRGRPK